MFKDYFIMPECSAIKKKDVLSYLLLVYSLLPYHTKKIPPNKENKNKKQKNNNLSAYHLSVLIP